MTHFAADPTSTLAAARDEYFRVNDFGPDGGYSTKWVDFKLGPIAVPFPNSAARVRAVKFHDLHHALTGYATDALGEFEISAWEVGGGCADFVAAWQLNLAGMAAGMFSIPRRTFAAFVRGRRTRNLYRVRYDDALLRKRIAEARRELGLDEAIAPASAADLAWFAIAIAAGLVVGGAMLMLLVPLAIGANLAAAFRKR